jgi:hypothetical protein
MSGVASALRIGPSNPCDVAGHVAKREPMWQKVKSLIPSGLTRQFATCHSVIRKGRLAFLPFHPRATLLFSRKPNHTSCDLCDLLGMRTQSGDEGSGT